MPKSIKCPLCGRRMIIDSETHYCPNNKCDFRDGIRHKTYLMIAKWKRAYKEKLETNRKDMCEEKK